jgi:alpha-1,6-mannosyl-glycoprotein beta-1,2-N-acetylglucosaminyltransferase
VFQKIDFARWINIFFPNSLQLNPHSFPGEGPKDCQPNLTEQEAQNLRCSNWEHADTYGHYRQAK